MKSKYKKYILKNIAKKSVKEIADELGISEAEIKNLLEKRRLTKQAPEVPIHSHRGTFFGSKSLSKPLILFLIIIAGLAVYANSFHNEFLFDDLTHVLDNAAIRSFKNIPGIFTHHLTYFSGDTEGYFFRPIETVSFMFDYFFWKFKPPGYHITNTLLHILVSMLLFYFMCLITRNMVLSGIVGLVYVVHPVHTEAVTYISGRADSIASIFLLLMVILQYRLWCGVKSDKRLYYALILIFFISALLTKEVSAVFPLLLIFFEYCMRDEETYSKIKGSRLLFYLPLFVILAVWFILKNRIVPTETMVKAHLSLNTRLTSVGRSVLDYVRLSLFPLNLHMEYRPPFPKSLLQRGYFEGFIFIVSFVSFIYYLWRKGRADVGYRIMFFGLGWFMIALLPYLNILFILNAAFAEHWVYIAEMGFLLFFFYSLFYLAERHPPVRIFVLILSFLIFAIFSPLTIRQNLVWKDELTFYSYTLRHVPSSAKMYNNLAVIYRDKGDLAKSKELLEKAVEISPSYDLAKENLRDVKLKLGEDG